MLQQRPTFSWRPVLAPMVRPRVMSQAVTPKNPVSPGVQAIAHVLALGMGAATAWVGFDTGARRSGLLSILGYVIGVGGAISAAVDLGILGVLGYRTATGKAPAPDSQTQLPLM